MRQFDWVNTPEGPTPQDLYFWMQAGVVSMEAYKTSMYWYLTIECAFSEIWAATYWTDGYNHGVLAAIYDE